MTVSAGETVIEPLGRRFRRRAEFRIGPHARFATGEDWIAPLDGWRFSLEDNDHRRQFRRAIAEKLKLDARPGVPQRKTTRLFFSKSATGILETFSSLEKNERR